MTGLLPIEQARCSITSIVRGDRIQTTQEQVNRLAPKIAHSRATATTLARNSISDEDLLRLLWIEVALRDPKPRPEIVRRLLGRVHTRERNRVMSACLTEEGETAIEDLI